MGPHCSGVSWFTGTAWASSPTALSQTKKGAVRLQRDSSTTWLMMTQESLRSSALCLQDLCEGLG